MTCIVADVRRPWEAPTRLTRHRRAAQHGDDVRELTGRLRDLTQADRH
jgi:hypothetical protein